MVLHFCRKPTLFNHIHASSCIASCIIHTYHAGLQTGSKHKFLQVQINLWIANLAGFLSWFIITSVKWLGFLSQLGRIDYCQRAALSHIMPSHLIDRPLDFFNLCSVVNYNTYGFLKHMDFSRIYLPGYIATTVKDFFYHKGIISSQSGYDFILQWKE